MQGYKIRDFSSNIYMLYLILCVAVMITLNYIFNVKNIGNPLIFFTLLVPILIFIVIILGICFTKVELEIIIDENSLNIKWLKQFFLIKKSNLKIRWVDIQDYVFEPTQEADSFKLRLKDGKKFNIVHKNKFDLKDDYINFKKDLQERIKIINSDENPLNHIDVGKTIYEGTSGLILAGFTILFMIVMPMVIYFTHNKRTPNYGILSICYAGAIYYLMMVIFYRRKNKK